MAKKGSMVVYAGDVGSFPPTKWLLHIHENSFGIQFFLDTAAIHSLVEIDKILGHSLYSIYSCTRQRTNSSSFSKWRRPARDVVDHAHCKSSIGILWLDWRCQSARQPCFMYPIPIFVYNPYYVKFAGFFIS